VAGSCEHGNEPSGSIKCGGFLGYLSVLLASQEGVSLIHTHWFIIDSFIRHVLCFVSICLHTYRARIYM
jgi:hypothetical protein